MKICLVRLPFPDAPTNPSLIRPAAHYSGANPYPPFGLLTLAAYLKDHSVMVCDMQLPGWCMPYDSDVYIISVFSVQLNVVHDWIAETKKRNPKAKFAIGGPGVTYNLSQAQKVVSNADLIYGGEGEYFAMNFEDIISKEKQMLVCPTVYNWVPHEIARWDLVDYQLYGRTRGLTCESSRGCCFNCVFCTASLITGKQWRPRKPSDVVDELKLLKKVYGAKKIHFSDDNITVDPERFYNLMNQIAEAKLNLKLLVPEGIQAHHLDFETLKAMKAAGLCEFTIGAESGVNRVLGPEVINKGGLTAERIEQVVRDAVKLGMHPSCFFVVGILGETLAEAQQTANFAEKMRRLGADRCTVRNAIPMPGTRMLKLAREQGCLVVPYEKLEDFDYVHSGKHLMITPEWTPAQIEHIVAESQALNLRHMARFKVLVHHPRSTLRLRLEIRRMNLDSLKRESS